MDNTTRPETEVRLFLTPSVTDMDDGRNNITHQVYHYSSCKVARFHKLAYATVINNEKQQRNKNE